MKRPRYMLPPRRDQSTISLGEDDILALLIAIRASPLAVHRKIEYLVERLLECQSELVDWKHSTLNKDEDRALRYWYLTRGTSSPITDDAWAQLLKEVHSYHFGINVENVNRAKVTKFAHSCVVVKTVAGRNGEKVAKEVKPKQELPTASLAQLEELLAKMKEKAQ